MPFNSDTAISSHQIEKDELLNRMQNKIRDIMETSNFKNWLETSGKLFYNKYSLNNAILINMQRPDASYVMGFEQWKSYGRQVGKGAEAIKIIVPVFAYEKEKGGLYGSIIKSLKNRLQDNKSLPFAVHQLGQSKYSFTMQQNGILGLQADGKESQRFSSHDDFKKFIDRVIIGKVPMYYAVRNVFDEKDVVQPEFVWLKNGFAKNELDLNENGDPVRNPKGEYRVINTPERQAKFTPTLDMTIPESNTGKMNTLYSVLQKISSNQNIPFFEKTAELDERLKSGADGYFKRPDEEFKNGCIVVNADLPLTRKVAVAFHEIAHSDMHGNLNKLQDIDRSTGSLREIQAEAVAYTVASQFGIKSDTASFNYIAAWSLGKELKDLKESLDVIHRESQLLLADIEKELDVRGLTLQLEPNINKPLTFEQKTDLVKKSITIHVEYSEKYNAVMKDITSEYANAADPAEREFIQSQAAHCKAIFDNLNEVERLCVAIGESSDREPQDDIIRRLNAVMLNIYQTENVFTNLNISRADNTELDNPNVKDLKKDFKKDPLTVLQDMQKNNDKLKNLSADDLKYISTSKFIDKEYSDLLRNNPQAFIDNAVHQLERAKSVSAKNGAFIEISSCEKWTEEPIFENGTVLHPKAANKMIGETEMQIRSIREQADKQGEYFPACKCDIIVYVPTKKGELSAMKTTINLGDKEQENLIDHLEAVCNRGLKKDILAKVKESFKDRLSVKSLLTPERPVIENIRSDNSAAVSSQTMTIDEWSIAINETMSAQDKQPEEPNIENEKTEENPPCDIDDIQKGSGE